MRVCVVYDCLYPYTVGGGERWYRNLAERLAAEGHEVTYVTLRQWERGQTPVLAEGKAGVVEAGPKMSLYTHDGRRRVWPPIVFGLGVLWHLLRRGRRYDAVHMCSFPYFSLLAAAVARPLGSYELAVDWFEVWSDSYWRDYLGNVGGRVGAGIQRLCARVRQRAFCYSELHARRLRQEGLRGEVTVLRGLYADTVEPAAVGATDRLVLFAGRMIPEKQAPLAVAAIAHATRRIEGLRGELLGDGPERETVLAEIAHHGLEEVVSAPGFTTAETVDAQMRRAMCLLAPSIREGYGLVVVEAAARGTPSVVVAGADNAAVELIEEGVNGFVCESSDPRAIAEAIVRVHEAGPGLRESTARWYALHQRELSLESSLRTVLASYGRDGESARA
ncbi:MAG TPA: glycosyltransferase [Solirubrobacteraceae bacterium]|jgi:glycosyltransferase involved in cell wall biosynthesis|nr:glycosyltransferase [Solirubrobacteraceae bacterium]